MKNVYFLILSVFFAGGLMAQSVVSTSSQVTNKKDVKSKKTTSVVQNSSIKSTTNITKADAKVNANVSASQSVDKKVKVKSNSPIVGNSDKTVVGNDDAFISKINKDYGSLESMPGYPKYIYSGDMRKDRKNYEDAVRTWVQDYKMSRKK